MEEAAKTWMAATDVPVRRATPPPAAPEPAASPFHRAAERASLGERLAAAQAGVGGLNKTTTKGGVAEYGADGTPLRRALGRPELVERHLADVPAERHLPRVDGEHAERRDSRRAEQRERLKLSVEVEHEVFYADVLRLVTAHAGGEAELRTRRFHELYVRAWTEERAEMAGSY